VDNEFMDEKAGPQPAGGWTGGLRAAIGVEREKSGRRAPPNRRQPLGQVLLRDGYITDEDINHALAEQAKSGKLIGEILVERGAVSRPIVVRALEEQAGGPGVAEGTFFTGLRDAIARNAGD
jgi:hypothetical protein